MINPNTVLTSVFSGNASGFQFHKDRALKDCVTYSKDGVTYVRENLTGFSCFDHITDRMKRQEKNIWKLKKGAILPSELKLVKDQRRGHEGHYMLAPLKDMPLQIYIGLIEAIERDPSKCVKLNPQEIKNGKLFYSKIIAYKKRTRNTNINC